MNTSKAFRQWAKEQGLPMPRYMKVEALINDGAGSFLVWVRPFGNDQEGNAALHHVVEARLEFGVKQPGVEGAEQTLLCAGVWGGGHWFCLVSNWRNSAISRRRCCNSSCTEVWW